MSVIGPQIGDEVTSATGQSGTIQDITDAQVTIKDEAGELHVVSVEDLFTQKPFLVFQCDAERKGCGEQLLLQEHLEPGQAAVLECENCGTSWSILLPSIEVYRTDEFEQVWKFTGQ